MHWRRGKQVLYLLPEIALTTQITERLQRVFGSNWVCIILNFPMQSGWNLAEAVEQ